MKILKMSFIAAFITASIVSCEGKKEETTTQQTGVEVKTEGADVKVGTEGVDVSTKDNTNDKDDETVMLFLDIHGSEGTKRMYEMYPYISLTLKNGGTMIIDEFDARLHSRLSKKIIELFNNPKTNPKNAQILVVTHDTNLLNARTFRRDQILFVEKNKNEESHIYSLAEFKGVRNDASFEKDYLDGRYGAVPFLNNFSSIFEN